MNKKKAYEEDLAARMDELNAKIDVLKAKARKAEKGAQLKYYEKIESLHAKQAVVKEKISELKEASESAWEDMKQGVDEAWKNLQDAFRSASSHFK